MSELGSRLIRAREARGLTLEDAERDTRISRRYLQALEAEQFEVIPAPVYARGFLRSYSQYLGEDPQEMLALFPRDEDDYGGAPPAPPPNGQRQRPTFQQPVAGQSPSRPAWRRPTPAEEARGRPAPGRPGPVRAVPGRQAEPAAPYEPTIGIDIGVPTPSRRIKTDPAAQTRSLTILIVAIGAVLAVVLLAFIISNLGGGDNNPGATGTPQGAAPPATLTAQAASGTRSTPTTAPAASSGLTTTRGIVPDVKGQTAAIAKAAIAEAGFTVKENHAASTATKGTVFDQSPAPGGQLADGSTVIIVVSDGP